MFNHFDVRGVAGRYARGRPYVHGVVDDAILRQCGRAVKAVDIGAGTGLSTRALLSCADAIVGVDPSLEMLGVAFRDSNISYVAGVAEQLPLVSESCSLATISAVYHWCDHDRLFDELVRVLRRGGWAAIYDMEFIGVADSPGLIDWVRTDYWGRLPRCSHNGAFDARSHLRAPFVATTDVVLRADVPMSLEDAVGFVTSQAGTINAVTSGVATLAALEARLRDGLRLHFPQTGSATAEFEIPLAILRKA